MMKAFLKLIVPLMILFLLLSCEKSKNPSLPAAANTIEGLIVSDDFDWRTTALTTFNISISSNINVSFIEIYPEGESYSLIKGKPIDKLFSQSIEVPKYVNSVDIYYEYGALLKNKITATISNYSLNVVLENYDSQKKSTNIAYTLPWTYTVTSSNHTILVPNTITLDGFSLSSGDYIGVFFDSLGTLACGGYTQWNPASNMFVTAWGNDVGNDGFQANEEFTWKIWKANSNVQGIVNAIYMPQNPPSIINDSTFSGGGLSGISKLISIPPSDSDNDGIPDSQDDFPNDNRRAFNNYYPALGLGTLAFEDLWPSVGDYDFNDLVIDFRFNTVTNASGHVVEIKNRIITKAIGASFHNGFGYELRGVLPSWITYVSGLDLQNSIINETDGLENGQAEAVIIAYDDSYNRLIHPGSSEGVNTDPNAVSVTPDTMLITINFDVNLQKNLNQVNVSNFNPFIFIEGERGKEVHLPFDPPTDLADLSYFGTLHDDSQPYGPKTYLTESNLPWAIIVGTNFNHTSERDSIYLGHLKFIPWVMSGGNNYQDWYKAKAGYRDYNYIYQFQ